jgi:hypothetical protein
MPINVITTYKFSGNLATRTTWSGDTSVDGWFGLAIDNSSATKKSQNYLFAMNAASKMDIMSFAVNIDY